MRARKYFGLFVGAVFFGLLGFISVAGAEGPTVQPPVDAPKIFVVPQNMEKEICEVLPEDMELAGGYKIGNKTVEESTILVEFNAAGGKLIKVRLGHPNQLEGAYTSTEKFALRLEGGDQAALKVTLDDLATRISGSEQNWQWALASVKVENYRDRTVLNGVLPECAEPIKRTEAEVSAAAEKSELLKIYEKNKTGNDNCDCWLLVEIMKKADMSIADQIEKIAEGMKDNLNYNLVLLSAGSYYQRNAQHSRAMNVWRKLAENDPAFTEVALPLARIIAMIGYKDEDIARYEERLKKNPADHNSDIILGVLKYYKRDYAGALPHFQRSVTYKNTAKDAVIFMIMTNFYLNKKDEAQRLIDAQMKETEHSKRLYYCQAMLLLEKDRVKAMEYLTKFIESHGIKVDEAAARNLLDVKEAWELLEYLKNWREDAGVDIFAPLDMQAPWPVINVMSTSNDWVQENK